MSNSQPNNVNISAHDPVMEVDGQDKMQNRFGRNWFRTFDIMVKKLNWLVGTQSTSASIGVATALPATPAGYMDIIGVDGKPYKIPYYNP